MLIEVMLLFGSIASIWQLVILFWRHLVTFDMPVFDGYQASYFQHCICWQGCCLCVSVNPVDPHAGDEYVQYDQHWEQLSLQQVRCWETRLQVCLPYLTLPYLTFTASRLLHLSSTEAVSVWPMRIPECNQSRRKMAVKLKLALKPKINQRIGTLCNVSAQKKSSFHLVGSSPIHFWNLLGLWSQVCVLCCSCRHQSFNISCCCSNCSCFQP